jgi:hypothetical protein
MTDKFTNDANNTLRDARLAKALQHAPDADALPSPAIRDTIKTIASSAIGISASGQLHAKTPWWKTLWVSTGSTRGPWGGALATLVLGCIITALWYGQEVPDEKVRYSGEAAKVVSADASAPAPTPSPAPARMQERAATTAPLAKSAAQETIPAAKMKAPVRSEEATAPAAPAVLADKATGIAAPMAAPAAAAAPAPTPAPASAATASAPVASGLIASSRKSRTTATEWHSASVQYQGRTTQLAGADAKQLDVYVRAVVNSATPLASGENSTPAKAAPVLRIVFGETDASTNGAQAVFTLWPGAMQWQRAGQADVLGVPQADALAALLAHVRSLPK